MNFILQTSKDKNPQCESEPTKLGLIMLLWVMLGKILSWAWAPSSGHVTFFPLIRGRKDINILCPLFLNMVG